MLLGYNTNGLSNHDGLEAIQILAEIGFRSIAITVDHGLLSPRRPERLAQQRAVRQLLADHGLRSVIESGARFLLDPWRKHHPTFLSSAAGDRRRRLDFLKYCVDLAADLGSDCVSIWSGAVPSDADEPTSWAHLEEGVAEIVDYGRSMQVPIALEPEPGMLVDTLHSFWQFAARMVDRAPQLTLDVGHLHCLGEVPLDDHIRQCRGVVCNIHIEDMKAAEHNHLMFGEGEIDFPPLIRALREIDYRGGVHVELSRHSHDAVNAARRSFAFLEPLINPPIQ